MVLSGEEYLLFYVIFAETQKFEEFNTGFILEVYLHRKELAKNHNNNSNCHTSYIMPTRRNFHISCSASDLAF